MTPTITPKTSEVIARTGRVQNWIDNPSGRLPVSCTVFVVQDTMEGPNGIEASWRFVSHALRFGAGCAVHLSNLRERGNDNGNGLIASGPCSFGKIYSCLNEQLRRGGRYKNGAVVLHLDLDHADILEFVEMPRHDIPWAKRCVNLCQDDWDKADLQVQDAILKGIARGDIWLVKKRYDKLGFRIYGNVCLEVFLPSRGTCLLEHINLGACRPEDIPAAFAMGMTELCELHAQTGIDKSGEYLPSTEDRQVGLGMLGLANLLALEGVTYAEFADALDKYSYGDPELVPTNAAARIVIALSQGISQAADIARENNMERAFAIAPTASCSYRSVDREGFTCTPEIAPPVGRTVDRDSSTFGVETFDYGSVEVAETVGWDVYKRVADGIMFMLQTTQLHHGYSYNSWSDVVTYDTDFVQEWLASPQTSLYYSLQVMQNTQAKDDAMAALDGQFAELFDFSDIEPTTNDCISCAE